MKVLPSMSRSASAAVLLVLALASGCATVGGGAASGTAASASATPGSAAAAPGDPWENWNRKVFGFNEKVDEAVLKPVATAYRDNVPQLVRTGVGNVLGNIRDAWSAANHLLQGKVHSGLDMGMRVLTNTVFGLGGVLDPATEFGLKRQSEDFGQTLGRWGVGPGPYIVLPLLGPSTLRDTGGLLVDRQFSPSSLAATDAGSFAVVAIEVINLRAELLSAGNLLDDGARDKYCFLRLAYLSRRLYQCYEGAPPMETFQDEGDEPVPAKGGVNKP
ncbi:MAG: VacJ family lipoprotein, partial [Rubrivivax sp.]|nr:VacJ family lipoprotein [Rubrivivax sp.]